MHPIMLGWMLAAGGTAGGFSGAPVKLANPATLPTGTGRGCSFSPDGTYLAVAHSVSPFLTIYK